MTIEFPKNPKIDDLVPMIVDLDARVAELEAWRVAHGAGMVRRQQQINGMQERARRDDWLKTLKRGRR